MTADPVTGPELRDRAAVDPVVQAARAAQRAAEAAGVRVRLLTELADLTAVGELYDQIWQRTGRPLLGIEALRAMAHAGNYVAGAFVGSRLVGACVGFFAAPLGAALHSHVAGVSAATRGRRVGFALKLHQRAWSLAQGIQEVTWTFDPLVRRNAYFNLVKLGALPVEYLVDFYGTALDDRVNAGQGSDRLLVRWRLVTPEVAAACAGAWPLLTVDGATPVLTAAVDGAPACHRPAGPTVLVDVPADVEAMRAENPALARRWRAAVREVLGGLLAGGARVTGFSPAAGYVVESRPDGPATAEGSGS